MPAFIVTTHAGDWGLCIRLLSQLLEYHKRTERVVIVDGPLPMSKIRALEGMCDTVIQGAALGQDTARPTKWLERMLKACLEHTSAEIIVKLDPDAYLTRAIRGYSGADLFGSLYPNGAIHGGAYGFRRNVAEKILESGILQTAELQLINRLSPLTIFEDEQISRAARACGFELSEWGEVCSRFKPEFPARVLSERYAVWHPVKTL